jgi:alginate O-acetyltransferase complex protein AlgI
MIFTEARFFVLFALCFGVYWSLRAHTARKGWLLACSAVFYGAWDWRFLGLMYVSVTMDWFIGWMLGRDPVPGGRRLWLIVSLVGNLGILGFFKYFNWFVSSAVEFGAWFGFHVDAPTLQIVLPVGISFYTFQSMSYTIDVYRRELPAAKSYLDFALFVTFFPQLVAGPIVRAIDFLPQLTSLRSWKDVNVRACATLFVIGFIKKACIADNLSPTVDAVFAAPEAWSAVSNWIAVILYAIQIYCDFSGYSDMAIATAGLLGYQLTLNFDFPYLAGNITEFWRRWHISLSTWFRDYLYIPLGGNRRGAARTYLNLAIVFFLCGLWHGASWTFVVWGLMHGAFLIVHRVWKSAVPADTAPGRFAATLGAPLTMIGVLAAWVVFRSQNLAQAWTILQQMFAARAGGVGETSRLWFVFVIACLAIHIVSRTRWFERSHERASDWVYAAGLGAALALVIPWISDGYKPFIYFQF